MIEYVLAASVRRRWLVLLVTLAAALSGVWSLTKLPIDAVPDVTNVQVQINALAPALSPVEIEKQVTFPIETALAGIVPQFHRAERERLVLGVDAGPMAPAGNAGIRRAELQIAHFGPRGNLSALEEIEHRRPIDTGSAADAGLPPPVPGAAFLIIGEVTVELR